MRLMAKLSEEAAKRIEKYPTEKVTAVNGIVQTEAVKLANSDSSYAGKVLRFYNIVYTPIVADILEKDLSGSVAEAYAINQLKTSLDKM